MKKYLLLFFIICILPKISSGQGAYYTTDSTTIIGIKLVEGDDIENSLFCRVKKDNKITTYSPYEVKEYRLNDGRTFKSFPIKIDDTTSRYFLERLVKGKTNLYYFRTEEGISKYYLTGGDSTKLLELPLLKEEYQALFNNIVKGCPQAVRNIPFVKIRKHNLIRFIQDYNNCAKRPLPRFHYGFSTGVSTSLASAAQKQSLYLSPRHESDKTVTIGVFLDIPIKVSNFSFHPEIYYKSYGISQSFDKLGFSYDLIINNSSICLPLLVRYSLLSKKISPYFQAGPVYSRAIKNEGTLFQYNTVKNNTYISIIDSPILQENMGGLSVGGGMILQLGSKYACFGEIGYSKFYNLEKINRLLDLSEITFRIGLMF